MTLFRALALIAGVTSACDVLPRPGDTQGVQQSARWEQHGRILVEPDPRYTIVHLRVDTSVTARHDVLLTRFDFDPSEGVGDEYALTVALRSEEHTSELQSLAYLVCRLLLEKKKKKRIRAL